MASQAPQVAPWDSNGVTINRYLQEQSVVSLAWGATQQRIPFNAFQPTGYLRSMVLRSPRTLYAGAVAGSNLTANVIGQLGPLRAIQNFNLSTTGASSLYNVTGEDLAVLNYLRNGRYSRLPQISDLAFGKVGASGTTFPDTALNGLSPSDHYAPYAYVSSTNATYGYRMDIPVAEYLRVKSMVANGQTIATDMWVELGMVTLQNLQQNLVPNFTLNPAYSPDYISPFRTTDTSTVVFPTVAWALATRKYDVPNAAGSLPPAYLQQYAITRRSYNVPIAAGQVTYPFASAGLLLQAAFLFYNDGGTSGTNGQYIDIGNGNNDTATIQFLNGSTNTVISQTVPENLAESAANYGMAPAGFLVLDFTVDGTDIQAPNTVPLTNVRALIQGLDQVTAPMNRLHVIEKRLIEVVAS